MSGIFSRRNYDNCLQNEIVDRTTKPGTITLEPSVSRSDKTCFSKNSPHSNRVRNTSNLNIRSIGDIVTMENYLLNLDIPDSKCMDVNTLVEKDKRLKAEADKHKNIYNVPDCGDDISTRYSRLNNNVNEIKDKPYNRYEFPLLDPKEFVYYGIEKTPQIGNNRAGISTRIDIKDVIQKEVELLKRVLVK